MTTCKVAEKIEKNRFFKKFTFWAQWGGKRGKNVEKWEFKKNDLKIKKIIFSQRPCKWSKNAFRGETTLVRCFFFRTWIMVKVSHTLKNPLFWFLKSCIFAYFTLRVRPKSVFCINKVSIHGHKNRKNCQKFKILLETWRITSGLSADSFMDL